MDRTCGSMKLACLLAHLARRRSGQDHNGQIDADGNHECRGGDGRSRCSYCEPSLAMKRNQLRLFPRTSTSSKPPHSRGFTDPAMVTPDLVASSSMPPPELGSMWSHHSSRRHWGKGRMKLQAKPRSTFYNGWSRRECQIWELRERECSYSPTHRAHCRIGVLLSREWTVAGPPSTDLHHVLAVGLNGVVVVS